MNLVEDMDKEEQIQKIRKLLLEGKEAEEKQKRVIEKVMKLVAPILREVNINLQDWTIREIVRGGP